MLSPSDPRHGTENAYNHHGCRCDACSHAHKQYMSEYRRKKAAKRFLAQCGEEIIALAQCVPVSSTPDECWIYDLTNPLGRRHVREVMYTIATGKIAPRLDKSKNKDNSYLRMICDPRCIRPEHIRVVDNDTHYEDIFVLSDLQLQVIAGVSYLPSSMCWLMPHDAFTKHDRFYMRKARSDLANVLLSLCSNDAGNCLNPAHFVYTNHPEKAPLPKGAVKVCVPDALISMDHPERVTRETSKKSKVVPPEKKNVVRGVPVNQATPTTIQIPAASTTLTNPASPLPLYTRPASGVLTPRDTGRRIQEFKRRITADLNAHVDFAACLTNKIVYDNEADADKAVHIWKSLSLDLMHPARAYKCHKCRFWHLTSKKEWSALSSSRSLSSILKG